MKIKLLENLEREVGELHQNSTTKELANKLLQWIKNPVVIEEFKNKGFDMSEYLQIENLSDYPIELSSLKGEEIDFFKRNLIRIIRSYPRGAFQSLRDTLENIFLLEVDVDCKNCGIFGLKVLKDLNSQSLVCMCPQCGVTYFLNGKKFTSGSLVIPTNTDLASVDWVKFSKP